MGSWRLGRGGYALAIMALLAVQAAPFLGWVDSSDWASSTLWLWVGALQVLKLVPTLGRCNDLGRSPDDAVFTTLLPIGANAYGFFFLFLDKTPTPKRWAKLRSRWHGQPAWFSAAPKALVLMARTPVSGLLGALGLAVPMVLMGDFLDARVVWLTEMDPATRELWASSFLGLAGLLTLYVFVQLAKYKRTTTQSWWPAVFWLPSWMVCGTLYASGTPGYDFMPILSGLLNIGVAVVWGCVIGTAVVLLWLIPAAAARAGSPVGLGEAIGMVRARYGGLMVAHSARVQWVIFGSQVIIPGLFYWVYSAFVDVIGAVEDDTENLTERSGRLAWGMMPRLVKLCAVYLVSWLAPSLALVAAFHGTAMVQAFAMGDVSGVSLQTRLLVEIWGSVVLWWVTVMLMLLYFGRRDQMASKGGPTGAEGGATEAATS